MSTPFFKLLRKLPDEDKLNGWWRLGRVMASGLGAHEKSVLLVLVRLDPKGEGLEISWEQLVEATSLSLSSVRRASDDLHDWGLLLLEARVAEDKQPLPNRFVHALGNLEHPLLKNPAAPFYRRKTLDDFLERREIFEQTLGRLIEEQAPAKGPKHKRQGREHARAPRPWRQTYGMRHPQGKALQELATFRYDELADNPRANLERVVEACIRTITPPPGAEGLARVTPSFCLDWCLGATDPAAG